VQTTLVAQGLVLLAAINLGNIAGAAACNQRFTPHPHLAGSPPPGPPTRYWFTTIAIEQGGEGVFAFAINNEGLVSGFYEDDAEYLHGFLWQNGVASTVDAPGDWADTCLGGGNDAGVIIGNYDDDLTVSRATLYRVRDQTWTRLPDIPGWPLNYGNGINNYGVAVGALYQGTPTDYYGGVGWIWDGRDYRLFTVPEASSLAYGTYAAGINDSGEVSGLYQDSLEVYHGFLKQGPTITSFDVPGADSTFAYGINNRDEVVGYYRVGAVLHEFIMQAGNFVTVDVPGATGTNIFGINDLGQIVGWYSDSSNPNGHGFVAIPIDHE
jgi:probable HAF family extracellular repeat protein